MHDGSISQGRGGVGHLTGTETESYARLGDRPVASVLPATGGNSSPGLDFGSPQPRQVLELLQTIETASFLNIPINFL